MSEEIILYDIPSRPPCKTWSPNTFKARAYLNYKNIPYRTEWTEYPDIASTLSPHIAPNPEGSIANYTLPAVTLPDGTWIQDSLAIAKKLEESHPSPPLKFESKYFTVVSEVVPKLMPIVAPEHLFNVPQRLLNEKSSTWWYTDRERRIGGMKLGDFRDSKGGAQITEKTAPYIKQIAELLKENPGPYFEGELVTWADIVWAGYIRFIQRIGEDTYELVFGEEQETMKKYLDGCHSFMARDDH